MTITEKNAARIRSTAEQAVITGGSAFNVKAASLRVGDFAEAEVRALLGQHTDATGQRFADGALRTVWELTAGQPWLVNALAQEACFEDPAGRDLTWTIQASLTQDQAWYVDAEGELRLGDLLSEFQTFFREHSEHWLSRFQYREAGPQLLLQAFLQRVVNSGGRVEREYGLGRMRTDLLIVWPAGEAARPARRMVIECKVVRRSREETIRDGLEQTRAYKVVFSC